MAWRRCSWWLVALAVPLIVLEVMAVNAAVHRRDAPEPYGWPKFTDPIRMEVLWERR